MSNQQKKRSSNINNKLNSKAWEEHVGKHTTLLLRWKMNVPNRSRKQILKRKEDQPNSFTYVKEKESQDSYLRILHV